MRSVALTILLILGGLLSIEANAVVTQQRIAKLVEPLETQVLICTGGSSKRYHAYKCSGLSNCGGDIVKVSLSDAQTFGRTPCKICYKDH